MQLTTVLESPVNGVLVDKRLLKHNSCSTTENDPDRLSSYNIKIGAVNKNQITSKAPLSIYRFLPVQPGYAVSQ